MASYGNADWVSRELGVIIIMPSGDRSFYVNMDNGQNYFSYLTEELPEWIDAALSSISTAKIPYRRAFNGWLWRVYGRIAPT